QNLEAMYAHVPGLRVGVPATAQDAYSMLLAAVKCDDPTLVIENRGLYYGAAQMVEVDGAIEKAQGAKIAREGTDVTIVTWGAMLSRALDAAQELAEKHGISAEVINARWIAPFDWEALDTSIRKT